MAQLVEHLTFMAGSLPRTPFRTLVSAAAKAGYDSMTIWPNIWRHAQRKEGLSLTDMRKILDDHGIVLTDVDAYRDWVPPPAVDSAAFGPVRSGLSREECFETCAALGGTTIIAVHLTDAPLDFTRDVPAFAKLCEDAARYGLRIALEFVNFSNIPDVATATRLVQEAGRENGGLCVDIGHHVRSTNDNAALGRVPPDQIYTIQISDGPAVSPYTLVEEAMYHRQFPGEGVFDVTGFLRRLAGMGAHASVGAELYHRAFETRDPNEVLQALADATRQSLAKAGLSS